MSFAVRSSIRVGLALTALLAAATAVAVSARVPRPAPATVVPCRGVHLTASYLAEVGTGAGPGFLFRIENQTKKEIRLEKPVPSSAHWYARVGDRWLWRASAGRGGALVNALVPTGPMFAWRSSSPPADPEYLTVPAKGSQQWVEAMRDHPAIAYRPSCARCNYPGESDYEAVFAYAYLPGAEEHAPELLRCGLRSDPVPMPPKALESTAPLR
ncbi:MAG: hypothetical protein WA399_04720 [Acidobacteriaceae bacterium]